MYTTMIRGHYSSISLIATLRSSLKKALSSKEAYAIMDKAIDGADTWVTGGCLLLANALKILMPEGKVVVAIGTTKDKRDAGIQESPEHVVLIYQNYIIDGDGVSTWKKFKSFWEKTEGVSIARLETLDYQKHHADYITNAITEKHKKGEKELAAYLARYFKI